MADIEPRVAVLEAAVGEIRAALARIEQQQIATTAQIAELRGSMRSLRGRVEMLPTTWVLLVGIIGGEVALAGVISAVVFGAAHLVGRL